MLQLTPRSSLSGSYPLPPFRFRGLGASSTLQLGEQAAGVAAGAGGAALAVSAASTAAAAAGTTLSLASTVIPFVGPAIAAATIIIEAIMNSGCGQTCIVATGFANQANAALQQNIEAYFQPRMVNGTYNPSITLTTESQAAALANFDQFWAWLQQQCSNTNLGDAGVRCITDRQAGACTWKQPASSVPPWGTPAAGACWNWFNGYRDPIANDTNVAPGATLAADNTANTTPAAASTGGASAETLSGNSNLILYGGLALLLFGMLGGNN